MDVKRFFGVGLDGGYHRWPDGEIGHEVVVHHIDVDVIGPGRIHGPDLFAQPGEVGGQDRWRDLISGHGLALPARPGFG
jgi:hypothetical protein